MKEDLSINPLPQDDKQQKEEKHVKDITIAGHTEVKNAHASGLGSMGRHDEEEEGPGKTQKD